MGPTAQKILDLAVKLVYGRRTFTFGVLLALTVVLGWFALHLQPDAGFEKEVPLDHPYMQVFKQYQQAFGGANLVSIALINHQGDIYNEHFLDTLKKVTDAVFFANGVDRSRVQSLFTPGVRYIEIVEGGFSAGDVIPRNYAPSPEMFARIRANVARAGVIGRLVSNDQRGALVVAELLEHDPVTGRKLDYRELAKQLEDIRSKYQDAGISIHIIGFAKIVGDVTDASLDVISFFVIALLLTLLLLWSFCGSIRLSMLPLSAAITAVIWELGLLRLAGFGLDPFAILVPFLILSIGVSHGVQYINGWGNEVTEHRRNSFDASVETFRRLFIPGTVAIVTNVIGFATLAFIKIQIVQEMAINAAMGMLAVIITNKVMLPIWLTWVKLDDADKFRGRQQRRQELGDRL
ncbi:MAG TPA: MMPL family transporter, partial [Nevskiaceae bacterium]|nr:MMPL family transporter [Nevskiaceae bacterium]